jgi:hypothetical protein
MASGTTTAAAGRTAPSAPGTAAGHAKVAFSLKYLLDILTLAGRAFHFISIA